MQVYSLRCAMHARWFQERIVEHAWENGNLAAIGPRSGHHGHLHQWHDLLTVTIRAVEAPCTSSTCCKNTYKSSSQTTSKRRKTRVGTKRPFQKPARHRGYPHRQNAVEKICKARRTPKRVSSLDNWHNAKNRCEHGGRIDTDRPAPTVPVKNANAHHQQHNPQTRDHGTDYTQTLRYRSQGRHNQNQEWSEGWKPEENQLHYQTPQATRHAKTARPRTAIQTTKPCTFQTLPITH